MGDVEPQGAVSAGCSWWDLLVPPSLLSLKPFQWLCRALLEIPAAEKLGCFVEV